MPRRPAHLLRIAPLAAAAALICSAGGLAFAAQDPPASSPAAAPPASQTVQTPQPAPVNDAVMREALAEGDPNKLPPPARSAGLEEHLGLQLPLDIDFLNAAGERVTLGKYFTNNNKPAIIGMVYYTCPVTCTAIMEKLNECVQKLDLTVGKDYQILMFSIKPAETTEMAAAAKELYLSGYDRGDPAAVRASWEFHTGPKESSKLLADALGFRYAEWRPGDYTHPVALFIATPDGKVARYLYGWEYEPRDVKLSLIEAASGRATIAQRILAFCYMWDGQTGRYTLRVIRVAQIAGVASVIALGSVIGVLLVAERARRRHHAAAPPPPSGAPPTGAPPTGAAPAAA